MALHPRVTSAIVLGGIFVATLSAFAMLLYVSLSRTLYEHHDHELLANGARVAQLLRTTTLNEDAIATMIADLVRKGAHSSSDTDTALLPGASSVPEQSPYRDESADAGQQKDA